MGLKNLERITLMSGIILTGAIILVFIGLILSNIIPVYSIDEHVRHGANISMQTQSKIDIIEENGVTVNDSPESHAEQIMTSCQDNDNTHCLMIALNDLNKTANRQLVLGTFSDLVQLYDENNYSCHHEGHHLGMWLYDYTLNLKEALNYATVLCGGAVYHGIFQSYFGEQFVYNEGKNQIMITNLCPINQENVNWLHERDCIHGIGHGLVKFYNYNTTAAVDRCNEFIPLWAQSACSRGVFMENTEYFVETGKGDFDKNDAYSPCNRAVEKFAPQCYYYYPEHNFERNNLTLGYNLTDAFVQCDNISPNKFVKFCYQGIGRMLAPFTFVNPEPSIEARYVGNRSSYHEDCLLGTLKTILKTDANAEVGFNFCGHSDMDFKATCYEIVGMWIKSFLYSSKQQFESECAKAPDADYAINCLNANSKTSSSIPVFEPV
jgi:hypothetical protein